MFIYYQCKKRKSFKNKLAISFDLNIVHFWKYLTDTMPMVVKVLKRKTFPSLG